MTHCRTGCGAEINYKTVHFSSPVDWYDIPMEGDVIHDCPKLKPSTNDGANDVLKELQGMHEILDDCFNFVSSRLSKQGKFYATVNIGDKKDDSWRGFPVVWRSLDFYKQVASSHGLTVQDIGPRQKFGYAAILPIEDDQRILKICKK